MIVDRESNVVSTIVLLYGAMVCPLLNRELLRVEKKNLLRRGKRQEHFDEGENEMNWLTRYRKG